MNPRVEDDTSPILLTDEIQSQVESVPPQAAAQSLPPGRVAEGYVIQVKHPLKGEIEGMTIVLLGKDSEAYRVATREFTELQLKRMAGGFILGAKDIILVEGGHTEVLVNLTSAWTGFVKDGKEIPCTAENVRQIYNDPGFTWLYNQVWTYLFELHGFSDVMVSMSGADFERLITSLLRKMGFVAEMTKASGDGGIDIEATLDKPIVGGRYLIQCKRFASGSLVGSPIVREFYGAVIADRKATKGILVTTSGYSEPAKEFAEKVSIELIDGTMLAELLTQHHD
jgi:hypothetical protein